MYLKKKKKKMKYQLCITGEIERRPGYVSMEILSDTVEGTYLNFYLHIHNLELIFKDST